MAGVYIKGMEMPECCEDCKLFNADYDACNYLNYPVGYEYSNKRIEDCPLVAVPDHGDLIDRDKLCKEMTDFCGKQNEEAAYTGNRLVRISWDDAYNFVENAPVVIPADKEEV